MVVAHGTRSFRLLIGAQFFGAFNDNLFKQLILFLAARSLFPGEDKQGLAFAIFALPFVLFSGMAGDVSERLSKRRVILAMKVAEVAIMGLAVLVLPLKSWPLLLALLFVMGTQSAFFGPSKYGVIPELVDSRQLLRANGAIAMTTFMAVLFGQALAGPLMDFFGKRLWVPGAACLAFAIVGTFFAWRIGPLPAQNPALSIRASPFGRLLATIQMLRHERGLMRVVLLHSLFWFNGGVLQQSILGLGEPAYLNVGTQEKRLLSYVMVTLALAIIAGSVAAPRIARIVAARHLVIIGLAGALVGQLALLSIGPIFGRGSGGFAAAHASVLIIGFFAALFVVPVQSFLQHGPPPGMRGQTFAVNNFMNFLFIFLAGIYYLVARRPDVGLSPGITQAIAGGLGFAFLLLNRRQVAGIRFDGRGEPS
jgi:acyl-[acyl-carrier-protein]-phospholipid O-acyltransferase/long-chain-fatty-acid--[acyl-carrier-protein] ligase